MRSDGARRLTGSHPDQPAPGAALELSFEPDEPQAALLDALARYAVALADRCGWAARATVRAWSNGGQVSITAPVDALDTAADLLDAAEATLARQFSPGVPDADQEPALLALQQSAQDEANPRLLAWLDAAEAAGVPAFVDDDGLTIGLGVHATTYGPRELPEQPLLPAEAWVPVAVVTGTNGKTTTSRLLAAIANDSGFTAGHTSSDGVVLAGEVLERGDWSGPGAARLLLRQPSLQLAVLELARGGLLRRGLPLTGYDVAILTNASEDHLGEYGLTDVDGIAWAKAHVVSGLAQGGLVVVRDGDQALARALAPQLALRPDLRVIRFGLSPALAASEAGLKDGHLWALGHDLGPADKVPLGLGGIATFNLENALASAAAAIGIGLPPAQVARTLASFQPDPKHNAGRLNLFALRGATVLVDFCHNPDGMARLGEVVARLPRTQLTVVLGQAGDRDDQALLDLAAAAAAWGGQRYIAKALPGHARGRDPLSVAEVIARGLREAGIPDSAVSLADDELASLDATLPALQPGELLVLLVHEHFDEVLARLEDEGATPFTLTQGA